jgi:hypothetical protein
MTVEGSGRSRRGMLDVMSVSCKEKHRKISNRKTSVKAKQNTNV